MQKTKTKKNHLGKSKRKGRGIDASKLIPSKIPISREEILRLRRERKTLKRETKAAEKAKAEETREQDAIINRFLTDTEKTAARALRDAAREAQEKADELVALKEENSKLKTELAIYKKKEQEEQKTTDMAEARIALGMGADVLKSDWQEGRAGIREEDRVAKERYNIDMAIEAAHKASDIYEAAFASASRSRDVSMSREPIKWRARVATEKAIFFSAIKAMDVVGEKFRGTEAYNGVQWLSIRSHLIRSIIWCENFTAKLAGGHYDPRDKPPVMSSINF